MGLGGISIWQLLIILAIIVLLFGTKKLRHVGADLGNAVKGFKKALNNEDQTNDINKNTLAKDSGAKSKDEPFSGESLNAGEPRQAASAKDTATIAAEK